MADDARSALDAFGDASPSGGAPMTLSNELLKTGDRQNTADVIRATQGLSTAPETTPAPAQDEGFLTKAWRTIHGLPAQITRDLTPTFNIPGTAAPQSVFADSHPMAEPHLTQGVLRGARDVIDTGAHWLASGASALLPEQNIDVDALRARDKTERDAWEKQYGDSPMASIGRVAGQTIATAGPVGRIGQLAAAGATAAPLTAIGNTARFLTGATPAATTGARALQLASQGAGIGGTQAALSSSGYDQSLPEQIGTGAVTGAVAGPVIGGLTKAVDVLRGYTGGINPDIARLAQTAKQTYGIDIPAPMLAQNPTLRLIIDQGSKLPFSGAFTDQLARQRQVQAAIAQEMGSTANQFGPAVMDATAGRLSRGYDTLYANAPPIRGGAPLTTDLANVGTDASRFLVGDPATHVGNAIREVTDAFQGGALEPRAYKSLMGTRDGTLAQIENAAPSAAQPYLDRIRQAVQSRFAASAGPDAAQELRDLDRQWRAMKTVQPLAEKSNLGDIQVGGLRQQVINASHKFDGSTGGVAYTGGGPLGDLGRVGQQFFGSLPDSGTAARSAALSGWKAAVAALPSLAVNTPLQAALRRPIVAQRMIDTSLGAPVPDISRAIPGVGLLGAVDYGRDRAP